MSRARTIVVGAAHWHVPLYAAAVAEVHRVVGVSDEDPERVRGLAELWGAPVETDWRRLLELPDVELAYVFGPHDQMAQTCLALIERRIPFVVEKPLGTSLEELQAVRQAAEEAGVPATVPLIQRGGPADSWLAKAGRPVYQRLSFTAGPPERYNRNGNPWMLDPERAGGGCLANLGPHFIDLFLQRSGNTTADVAARLSTTLHTEDDRRPRDPGPDHAGRPGGHRRGRIRVPAVGTQALLQLLIRRRCWVRVHRHGRVGHLHHGRWPHRARRHRRGQRSAV